MYICNYNILSSELSSKGTSENINNYYISIKYCSNIN